MTHRALAQLRAAEQRMADLRRREQEQICRRYTILTEYAPWTPDDECKVLEVLKHRDAERKDRP